ncbi:MAG: bifunctional diaminohydroxyphosphoribosylaminopyrimidine deaminase/5-amino-6-(5-phosphoribosylamino)uracil reductase RibD, partial [bacterium]
MVELVVSSRHEKFMKQALQAARKGEGRTGTNPLVGACLVKDGKIVGTAGHLKFGGPHAEARLLSEYESEAPGADLYCTLEPCTHSGKTPPCLPRVIDSGVKRVILAHSDPNPEVAGRGIKRLVEEKIEVIHPVLRREYRELNRAYFYRLGSGLPWVEIKLALSADGYIASSTHHSQWLNSQPSRVEVHR